MAPSFFPRIDVPFRLISVLLVWAAVSAPASALPQQPSSGQNSTPNSSTHAPAAAARATTNGKSQSAPRAGLPSHDEDFTIAADQQRQVGKMFYADGNVDILFGNTRLRGDHVEYNRDTQKVFAHGHVKLDYNTQHIEAEDGTYDVNTGTGTFHHVRATFAMQRRPSPTLLVTPNPLYFEADVADRTGPESYKLHHAWLTVCEPDKPTWEFHAQDVSVEMQRSVRLEKGDFRLFSVPVILMPYATFPAGHRRQSGFLIPDFGNSTQKGFFLGEDLYWAPTDWMDTTLGGTYMSKRGWAQNFDFRSHPWENARLDASYTGVIDRGLEEPTGPPLKQGGHEIKFLFDALLPDGWRAVAELNQLSSLTYRLAFAETFTQAVNSEVRNTAFLTRDFNGFSLNFAALSYKNFLSATPETSIDLRTAPEARFGSVDQAPFHNLPLYFSFDSFVDALHRGDNVQPFTTSAFVERMEFAPSVTMPLHWGPWLNVTPSFTFRTTHYGAQLEGGAPVNQPFERNTEEFTLDIRPPTLDRVYYRDGAKWKHAIEPDIVYRYVDGVNDYARFIRFDEDETLTDTNEVEYGVTQRLYRRDDDGDSEEFASWRLVQKYYFDPTFGDALIPGQRNVFQALDSLTPFAFADTARRWSPIVSDLRITPGGHYDAQFIVNYDPVRERLTAIGTLLKLKPYRESFLTLAHFSTINLTSAEPTTDFQPRSNQIRMLGGYGDMTRIGWNATLGFSYDVEQHEFQNQVAQLTYNGSCCGIGLEYRRLSLGTVREENQYRFVFLIANLGSVGNLRRQEKVF